jgi:hypothetical protein
MPNEVATTADDPAPPAPVTPGTPDPQVAEDAAAVGLTPPGGDALRWLKATRLAACQGLARGLPIRRRKRGPDCAPFDTLNIQVLETRQNSGYGNLGRALDTARSDRVPLRGLTAHAARPWRSNSPGVAPVHSLSANVISPFTRVQRYPRALRARRHSFAG